MSLLRIATYLLVACLLAPCLIGHGAAADRPGIVLVHGKRGMPEQLKPLGDRLIAAGYRVERPLMCWSRTRIYDLTYLACLRDIDDAAALRAAGAGRIVIVGMSLGGSATLAYGARHEGMAGIVALAPAPAIDFVRTLPIIRKTNTRP